MLSFIIFMITCESFSLAQKSEIIVPLDNKTRCISQMQEWCDNMQYPQQGVGLAILSLTYEDPNNAYYRVFCASDSDGTNCTRNREPWFACSPDHVLTYMGRVLTNASAEGVDDSICKTAEKAFNELFVQNLSYDNTTLKNEVQKGMEAFFQQMAAMAEEIAFIQRMLNRIIPSAFGVDENSEWRDVVLQESPSSFNSTISDPVMENNQNSTEEISNLIEKV